MFDPSFRSQLVCVPLQIQSLLLSLTPLIQMIMSQIKFVIRQRCDSIINYDIKVNNNNYCTGLQEPTTTINLSNSIDSR